MFELVLSELVLSVVYFDIYDNKQIDVSAECADKGINIYGSEIIIIIFHYHSFTKNIF